MLLFKHRQNLQSPSITPDFRLHCHQQIKSCNDTIDAEFKKLKRLQSKAKSARKSRQNDKNVLADAYEQTGDKKFKKRKKGTGPPSLIEKFPGLEQTMLTIIESTAAADPQRRSQVLHACNTLDDLHKKLKEVGYHISRSGLFFIFVNIHLLVECCLSCLMECINFQGLIYIVFHEIQRQLKVEDTLEHYQSNSPKQSFRKERSVKV